MKTRSQVLIVIALFFSTLTFAQENYTVKGTTYSLHTEVEGTLTLLWNVIDGEYRYFAKKGDEIVELKNTRQDGKYREEYKDTLALLTADQELSVARTNLTLVSLRDLFNSYNKKADPAYIVKSNSVDLEMRLGLFGGVSNNNSTTNPENVLAPMLGVEFEVTDNVVLKRHALLVQFRYSFEAADYDLTFGQFALNYRFKFIQNDQLAVFAQAKMFVITFSKLAEDNVEGLEELSKTSFNTPIGLGLGMDYRLGKGFLTLAINDLVAPGLDTNGEFPIDITLGYKIVL